MMLKTAIPVGDVIHWSSVEPAVDVTVAVKDEIPVMLNWSQTPPKRYDDVKKYHLYIVHFSCPRYYHYTKNK